MCLSESVTTTSIRYSAKKTRGISLDFRFEDKPRPDFEKRIRAFLESIKPKYGFLDAYHLDMNSSNTFPHSSGIASSAAAFSALALGLTSIAHIVSSKPLDEQQFMNEASHLSRLGSGSACRSVYGSYAVWGAMSEAYSDSYAMPVQSDVHPVYAEMQDAILIVSAQKKKVGSSAGHALMEGHPFASARYDQALFHMKQLLAALKSGDLDAFVRIVESEALSLHAMMMASNPGFVLMSANTISIIDRIRAFRQEAKIPICFTLDAGPNVHLLFPIAYKKQVHDLINEELLLFCSSNQWIDDGVGQGPLLITNEHEC